MVDILCRIVSIWDALALEDRLWQILILSTHINHGCSKIAVNLRSFCHRLDHALHQPECNVATSRFRETKFCGKLAQALTWLKYEGNLCHVLLFIG